jgi:hypothetical protein
MEQIGRFVTSQQLRVVRSPPEPVSRSYDELYGGNGEPRRLLWQYAIISVQSVPYRPVERDHTLTNK